MRQATARKSFDAYLAAPRRSERAHLHVVEDREAAAVLDPPRRRITEDTHGQRITEDRPARRRIAEPVDARVPAPDPAIERPDWAVPFEDARWDDALGR